MRLRMLKHCVGKGRHVMKPLHIHVCIIVLQYYAIVATGRAGYVLYRALVVVVVGTKIARSHVLGICACCKHKQSVDIGEKLVFTRFELLKKA